MLWNTLWAGKVTTKHPRPWLMLAGDFNACIGWNDKMLIVSRPMGFLNELSCPNLYERVSKDSKVIFAAFGAILIETWHR